LTESYVDVTFGVLAVALGLPPPLMNAYAIGVACCIVPEV
jgi:hypothetical protein